LWGDKNIFFQEKGAETVDIQALGAALIMHVGPAFLVMAPAVFSIRAGICEVDHPAESTIGT
jgi:hypothetical protein